MRGFQSLLATGTRKKESAITLTVGVFNFGTNRVNHGQTLLKSSKNVKRASKLPTYDTLLLRHESLVLPESKQFIHTLCHSNKRSVPQQYVPQRP